jgi:hypothetical protein
VTLLLLCAAPAFGQSGVAILYSQNSRTWFGLKFPDCTTTSHAGTYQGKAEFDRYYDGWTSVLDQYKLAWHELKDEQMTAAGLAPYKVLILSNAVSLSDAETKAILDWVRKGGRLLATFGSGYSDIVTSASQLDQIQNLEKGGTDGLHSLWHDPMTKVASSQVMYPDHVGAHLWVTQTTGPTAGIRPGFLPYGALANILVQRPLGFNDAYAFLMLNPSESNNYNGILSNRPAVIAAKAGQGLVVYFSIAPEYMVTLVNKPGIIRGSTCDYDVPANSWWWDSAAQGSALMMSAVKYLLNN